MAGGRPRKPLNLHLIQGTDKKNPKRIRERKNEPKPTKPIGAAPRWMDDAEKKAWNEIKRLVPPGVLANSDRLIMEQTCRLLVALRIIGPLSDEYPKLLIRFERHLGLMAMTPADRSRVQVHDA